MKQVFVIHGWEGSPNEGWFPWLEKSLEDKGFQVNIPSMPDPSAPVIEDWVEHLRDIVEKVDEDTFFVGHSIGCQTILRYLETLDPGIKVGGAVFIGGWFKLMNLETEEEKEIAKPWLEIPINFSLIKTHTTNFVAIFSDNDPVVPLNNKELFFESLNAKIIIEKDKGHFSGSDGITELPSAFDSIFEISNSNV